MNTQPISHSERSEESHHSGLQETLRFAQV